MFLAAFASGPWQANCYVIAQDNRALIIDPGMESNAIVHEILKENKLVPVAVLATHGHLDHIGDAAALADEYDIAVWIHSADKQLLTDPVAGLGAESRPIVAQWFPDGLPAPAKVCYYDEVADPDMQSWEDGTGSLKIAGFTFTLTHAPGHTPGCVLLSLPYTEQEGLTQLVFTGDVLFAGSVGRTDLPMGDPEVMLQTLAGAVSALPDTAALLPGHGAQSFMGRERANNPYLQPRFLQGEGEK